MLAVQVRETVRGLCAALQGDVADYQRLVGDRQGLPQKIAVLIVPLVAVVIAQKLQGVAGL